MLLLAPARIDERRVAIAGALAPLADSIAADLEPLLDRAIYLPEAKALLSRAGGRCEVDGSLLDFDPFSPHEHLCPVCGRTYRGELHHRWWVYSYQLWLAERAVHASLLHVLRGDARHGRLARDIAHLYAGAYERYPNRDNVLGPTRVFFSTYLESIWLLQLCVVTDALEVAGDRAAADELRTRIVRPSAALISEYDEGLSNRQVWNNAALLAAALVRGDHAAAEGVIRSASGVEAHLRHGLLADGTWYEGENYHLFAHRGLWYSVVMAEVAGIAVDPSLLARFQEGFATPFATALPDFTLPSRKDSQYAVSLQQMRFAELCELGLARQDDPRLMAALARLYSGDAAEGDTARARSTADVEHNGPPIRLSRADLGWRSLLHARAQLPPMEGRTPQSALLDAQGIAVFRRAAGEVYVALDYGQSGGGHGHPDRLNLLFAQGDTRWLDDLGTGSYVDPSLHWYRSTLAHNAPLIDGRSQLRADGRLLAHDERGGVGWVLAEVDGLAPGVHAERALVVTPDYFVDEVRWTAGEPVRFELPVHFDATMSSPGVTLIARAELDGGAGLEDGFSFARDVHAATVASGASVRLDAITAVAAMRPGKPEQGSAAANSPARAWVCADLAARWYRASGPDQPATALRPFYVVRCEGSSGVIRSVWAWSPRVDSVSFTGDRIEVALGAERHVHRQTDEHWQVELTVGGAASGIELTGWRQRPDSSPDYASNDATGAPAATDAVGSPRRMIALRRGTSVEFDLGELHYRRSEDAWHQAGRPSAHVGIAAEGAELTFDVRVTTSSPVFVARDAVNPYDNEHPDINGDGVQLYVTTPLDGGAWVIVPEPAGPTARARALEGWGALELRSAEWERAADGYLIRARVALPPEAGAGTYPVAIDVLVNETAPGRERRRGQLVLSGAAGEFVYLRGDRHDPALLVPLLLTD
jgi:heparinase II/III-like protein